MSLATWTKEQFGTNISVADDQHRTIFSMLNTLHDSVAANDRIEVGKKLDSLIGYVVEHFAEEERLMQVNGYPTDEYAVHKSEHDKMVETCGGVQKRFHAGEIEITPETTAFVRDWLYSHIPHVDKPYGPFLNGKGIG